jgi:hypothetical protein
MVIQPVIQRLPEAVFAAARALARMMVAQHLRQLEPNPD